MEPTWKGGYRILSVIGVAGTHPTGRPCFSEQTSSMNRHQEVSLLKLGEADAHINTEVRPK